jgi:hypothetical protein
VLAATAAAVVTVSSYRVSSARIEIVAHVSEAQLITAVTQSLTDFLPITSISLDRVASFRGLDEAAAPGSPTTLHLDRSSEPFGLNPIADLPAGTAVTMAHTFGRRYRLTLEPPPGQQIAIGVSFSGALNARVDREGESETSLSLSSGRGVRQIAGRWATGQMALITFETMSRPATRLLQVQALQFERDEQVGRYRIPVSTIREGTLSFPDFGDRHVTLGETTRLTLTGPTGYARLQALDPTGQQSKGNQEDTVLKASLSGEASNVELGADGARRSQMPTWLDVVTGQSRWIAIGSTVGALLALMFASWTWWKESE